MDRTVVIKLIKTTYSKDSYGVSQPTETAREVYAQLDSVTASEFFEGGRNGLNPEYRFRVFLWDYQDERVLEYNGKRYSIYRTYEGRNDTLDLYAERKGGTNTPPAA